MPRIVRAILIAAICAATPLLASAQDHPAGFWVTPTVEGFGKMHPLPGAAYQPQAAETYKIVFAVTRNGATPSDLSPSLDRVARTVNLYVSAGVPLSHLKFVAVAYADATSIALDNAHYQAKFGVANPNLSLIAALKKAGVDVAVCGQAVAEHDFDYAWLDSSVTLALAALTTLSTLEHQGYVLVQL
jgi:intracellular sulfur oxidation DsrE/DsrF family protein